MNYYIYQSDITIDLQNNDITLHKKRTEDWNVTVLNTGLHSSIPERIKMIQGYLADEPFIVSYGDCVSDINIDELVKFHKKHGKLPPILLPGRSEEVKFYRLIQTDNSCKAQISICPTALG